MRIIELLICVAVMSLFMPASYAQETAIALNYKHKRIDATGNVAYTKALILLHPIYNGADLPNNYAVGHLVARRGSVNAMNRLNTVFVNSSSAYRTTSATLSSFDDVQVAAPWKFKTCFYNGTKYLALDIPYTGAQHSLGFQFAGWNSSSGESLKFVIYDINGVPQNIGNLTDIADYAANMDNTQQVKNFNVLGRVGIGTTTPTEELSVNGNIRAKEIKVETVNWPDYVFEKDHKLMSLDSLGSFINKNGHLPDIPTAKEVELNGVQVGEMVNMLLKKNEELTLYILQQDRRIKELEKK
ncbi:hypothetical protein FAZ15_16170 [Sphingobacterium olei]|uniref:Tail fiber domain-containing protein n=1 Tax=Sphingobacterium olei TaxID=2571155 RepID=A0A4U0NHB2_9SPHI|nr:hypothetical protein [Sphingobacterium olei]TJZ53575.1 hypothetical protein FAZ15_16170 [Sphingobacterium olei]